jgi:hypothetical protein
MLKNILWKYLANQQIIFIIFRNILKLLWLVKINLIGQKCFAVRPMRKSEPCEHRSTHTLSVPCPRTYNQKWWYFLSSQRKNIISKPFPKHAAFLSRYFNHEPCMNNAGLVERDALHRNWRCSRLKLLSTWITCGSRTSSGCKEPGTQRHKGIFLWKLCTQRHRSIWTWHVHHSGLAGALMPWTHPITPQHEFSLQSSEEKEHHTILASIFLRFV